MNVTLEDLAIKAPLRPSRRWNLNERDWEKYLILAYVGNVYVGRITITRGLNLTGSDSDRFFLDVTQDLPVPKPFVSYQETEEQFRGQGINGRIITLANEFYRGRLGTTFYSDTTFVHPFKESSKRVWQKLQEQGLAVFEPHNELDRWYVL